jgi:hypothetical protein
VVHDIAKCIPLSKPLRNVFYALGSPFRNFILFEDVVDPANLESRRSTVSKTRVLGVLALVEVSSWLGGFVYGMFLEKEEFVLRALVATLAWVSPDSTLILLGS